jgi:hypothetical protein
MVRPSLSRIETTTARARTWAELAATARLAVEVANGDRAGPITVPSLPTAIRTATDLDAAVGAVSPLQLLHAHTRESVYLVLLRGITVAAIGFLHGPCVRDDDGLTAASAMLMLDRAARQKLEPHERRAVVEYLVGQGVLFRAYDMAVVLGMTWCPRRDAVHLITRVERLPHEDVDLSPCRPLWAITRAQLRPGAAYCATAEQIARVHRHLRALAPRREPMVLDLALKAF